MSTRFRLAIAVLAVAALCPKLAAQESSPTVWKLLSVPQSLKRITDGLLNRTGNHPGLELKPPVLKLGDPANLKPEMPPIVQAAAKIKQQEDLKRQKIKAIKYATEYGCGCYDRPVEIEGEDGEVLVVNPVTDALKTAMQDCTEEVRFATVRYIKWASESGKCGKCGCRSCCKEDLIKEMAKLAYDIDKTGNYVEPSERVRQAAAEALRTCCPGRMPVSIVTEKEEEPPVDPPKPDETVEPKKTLDNRESTDLEEKETESDDSAETEDSAEDVPAESIEAPDGEPAARDIDEDNADNMPVRLTAPLARGPYRSQQPRPTTTQHPPRPHRIPVETAIPVKDAARSQGVTVHLNDLLGNSSPSEERRAPGPRIFTRLTPPSQTDEKSFGRRKVQQPSFGQENVSQYRQQQTKPSTDSRDLVAAVVEDLAAPMKQRIVAAQSPRSNTRTSPMTKPGSVRLMSGKADASQRTPSSNARYLTGAVTAKNDSRKLVRIQLHAGANVPKGKVFEIFRRTKDGQRLVSKVTVLTSTGISRVDMGRVEDITVGDQVVSK